MPGKGINVPNLKIIKAKRVNNNLCCKSFAFEKAEKSILATILSDNDAILLFTPHLNYAFLLVFFTDGSFLDVLTPFSKTVAFLGSKIT